MAESGPKNATVTALGSLFPAEEAEKASKRVHGAIADLRSELDRLNSFATDNSALTKLVRQLPDEISHEIMVPFGSAAFFPGRFIHTNEFLVLLGDGYYAERTSKQTAEILKRRQKTLVSQAEALKATLLDLETEAKFFDATAVEAKEGIVEIREEYAAEPQTQQEDIVEITEEYIEESQGVCEAGTPERSKLIRTHIGPYKEDDYARMMAKVDKLEKEELEAGSGPDSDQDDDAESAIASEPASGSDDDDDSESHNYVTGGNLTASQNHVSDSEGKMSERLKSMVPVRPTGQDLLPPIAKPASGSHKLPDDQPYESSVNISRETGKASSSDRKAFTGSVVEHAHGLPSTQPANSAGSSQPSKPVSRFKMMKGNR